MNTMWGMIFGGAALAAIGSVIFLWSRFCKFGIVNKLAGDSKWKRRLLGLIPMLIFVVFMVINLVNTAIVMIHMAFYWLIAELICLIIRKIRRKGSGDAVPADDGKKTGDAVPADDGKTTGHTDGRKKFRPYWLGIIVLAVELCYFSVGWYLDHHVWETDYQLVTEKDLGMEKLRIAQVTDSHIGNTLDGEDFAREMEKVYAAEPDILFITGDFVDDGTTKEDMLRCCLSLAGFPGKYGVYFVYGNHDKGYFNNRDFTYEDMEKALTAAGVHILKDGVELVDDKFYVVGRRDRSMKEREAIGKMVEVLDPSKYIIILDHQPNDYAAEAATGADLVLSGHTHGGQLIIMNLVGALTGANDRSYGMEVRDKTTFIVNSGISDWSIKFKTGCFSEYVIIDVTQK